MTVLFFQVQTFKEVKKLTHNVMLSEKKSERERQILHGITSEWKLGKKKKSNSKKQNRIMLARGWQDEAHGARSVKETKCQLKENVLRI